LLTAEDWVEIGTFVDNRILELAGETAAQEGITVCYACGGAGSERNRRDGGRYYKCQNEECGFVSKRDGKFYHSSWDASNWAEKKQRAAGRNG
jgi:hypothetical protein